MNNYQFGFNQPQATNQQAPNFNQFQQIQQMFPQPQGSVYSINTPLEIGNVPIGGTGLSVALCVNEKLMYIKSFQNGSPVIMAYKIIPYTKEEDEVIIEQTNQDPKTKELESRISRIEDLLQKMIQPAQGGKTNELL